MNTFTSSKDDVSKLTLLGSAKTEYKLDEPSIAILETFPNLFDNIRNLLPFAPKPDSPISPKSISIIFPVRNALNPKA